MPIYEYICNACGHQFEEWQKITDAPVKSCPSCGKRKVERLVSLSAFHLRGGGWYVTDYGGRKTGAQAPSGKPKETSPSSETKPDKPEKKSSDSGK